VKKTGKSHISVALDGTVFLLSPEWERRKAGILPAILSMDTVFRTFKETGVFRQ
jgi:hypothetical protein